MDSIIENYKMSSLFWKNLDRLKQYKVCILCDDSDSMKEKIGTLSKWSAAKDIVVKLIDILNQMKIDFNINFLNNTEIIDNQNNIDVSKLFERVPEGDRYMRKAFLEVLESNREVICNENKNLLVIMIIGGQLMEQTDDEFQFFISESAARTNFLMTLESNDDIMDKVYVSIVSLTQNKTFTDELRRWDAKVENLDIVFDYDNEKAEVLQCAGISKFTYGDYLCKILLGSHIEEIDQLNETDLFLKANKKYGITGVFADSMRLLDNFKVVIICDDSSLMNESMYPNEIRSSLSSSKYEATTNRKKWNELKDTCVQLLNILNSCNIEYECKFLNRNVRDNTIGHIKSLFGTSPGGTAPLREKFEMVVESNGILLDETERNLLVVMLTNGMPTEVGCTSSQALEMFKNSLKKRDPIEKIFVQIVSFTNDKSILRYLNMLDRTIQNLDVVDDYETVKNSIQLNGKLKETLSKGNYMAKILLSSLTKIIDEIDEFL